MKYNLPRDFIMGASAAAWQTEGWTGKKEEQDSLIDAAYKFAPERWHDEYGPAIATDFYNRYKEDCDLMKELGMQVYRTSIDWSRFIRNYETGEVNEEAAAFYSKVVDELIENGVEPIICLEHWELPYQLYQKYGGWNSKEVVEFYVKYAEAAFKLLGHKVKYWFTFNEPIVFPLLAIQEGIWYPYKNDTQEAMQWNYHKVLANAKAVKLYHEGNHGYKVGGKIGIILNAAPIYPRSQSADDVHAAKMCDLFHNKLYTDPCIKGEFSEEYFPLLKKHGCMIEVTDEELAIIKTNTIDIMGLNYYTPYRVKARSAAWNPEVKFNPHYYYENYELQGKKMNPFRGWEIYAQGLYDFAMVLKNEYNNLPWLVTENGMGVEGEWKHKDTNGVIQDDYRIDFVSDHLRWLFKAIEEGSNCLGYLMWNFTDNVSPYNAFKNRYGYVEIDLDDNRNRRIKKSGYWFKKTVEDGYFEYQSYEPKYK
jgi:6-phospho-beta-glucosidase